MKNHFKGMLQKRNIGTNLLLIPDHPDGECDDHKNNNCSTCYLIDPPQATKVYLTFEQVHQSGKNEPPQRCTYEHSAYQYQLANPVTITGDYPQAGKKAEEKKYCQRVGNCKKKCGNKIL